ncbi:MAG: DNA double-strand break repair nuclease NurA [Candidatus Thorarchaeota archaeon]|nr:DNA double-strand break repair nuclease NurA [Candidatus Thorarchaeota archaeon]
MDKNLDKMLSLLVEEIERVEVTRERFGTVMNDIKETLDLGKFPALTTQAVESQFITQIEPAPLNGLRIAGVDGGLTRKRFRSMDLLLTRGIAVVFQFMSDEGPLVEFYPDPFPEPSAKLVMLSMSGPELDQLASLERMAAELRVTISALDEFHTDIILVDGSLFYHPRDRPPVGTATHEKFQEVVALYRQLYNKIAKKRTTLVGIVKDSRSTRIVNTLGDILPHILRNPAVFEKMQGVDYRWLLKISSDCDLLDTFLEEGERTFAFRYSGELPQNSNSPHNDLSIWASSIWVTYLKTARDDLPLRIEVMVKSDGEEGIHQLNRTLAAILPLSYQHPEYGLPSPIVEADARARISNNEARLIIDRLMALSGLTYSTLEKRRSRNPFGG